MPGGRRSRPPPVVRRCDRRRPASKNGLLISSALADDHSDIVVLFVRTELSGLLDYRRDHCLWRQLSVRFQRFDQTLFAEFFTHIVE
jgi:hypothetical protein